MKRASRREVEEVMDRARQNMIYKTEDGESLDTVVLRAEVLRLRRDKERLEAVMEWAGNPMGVWADEINSRRAIDAAMKAARQSKEG